MGSRRTSTGRVARRALILTAAAGMVLGGGTAWRVHADDYGGGSTADCVTGWPGVTLTRAPVSAAVELNIEGEKSLHLEPWQAHILKGETRHGFTNNNASVALVEEIFIKKTARTAGLGGAQALAMALATSSTAR